MREQPSMACFGPDTEWPYLFFRLSEDHAGLAAWLLDVPCPVIGLIEAGQTCPALEQACDVLVTSEGEAEVITANIEAAPIAAMTLVQQLRLSEQLPAAQALTAESLAYATVQKGPEFSAWLTGFSSPEKVGIATPLKISKLENGGLELTFSNPHQHNVITAELRDALCEALELARLDPEIKEVFLSAQGRSFSIGGDLYEFGRVSDPATAHWIRSIRLPARELVKLAKPLNVTVEGAAIGAGTEIAAFAGHLRASSKAWFQLPELKYGLIPGAGGTVSLTRKIGRHRTAYMALSMRKIRARQAYEWGLVDQLLE
ncbi:MAG: enoyl-CoA hydratase/isomerase family protein [Parvibaculales bacterium]